MKSRLDWHIIKHFSCKKVFGFALQDVASAFPKMNRVYLIKVLADMVEMGMLLRITHNRYLIIPLSADPNTYVPDYYQVAKYFMREEPYYIGYTSALILYGLTPQNVPWASESEVMVVTRKQIRPAIRQIGGITCHFIRHDEKYFFGFENIWLGGREKAMVSDMERTIVDLATLPRHGGGIIAPAYAIAKGRGLIDYDKLLYYLSRNRSFAAAKRILFITDLLGLKWTNSHEKMRMFCDSGTSLLDPSEPNGGKIHGKFGLKINVDPALIKKSVYL